MRNTTCIAVLFAATLLAGCAADPSSDPADPAAEGTEDELKQDPSVRAFLNDPAVKKEIGGKRAAPPQMTMLDGGSFGMPIKTYLVATWVDVTPPGLQDANFSKSIVGTVSVASDNRKPEVRLAKVVEKSPAVDAKVHTPASKEGAVSAYLGDAKIKAALAGRKAGKPVALQLSAGSSFGGEVVDYLVVATYDATPIGMVDARITRAVYGHVFYSPAGAQVSMADVVDSKP